MKTIIGVMVPGEEASEIHCRLAYDLGRLIAQEKWIILTGGRNCGVMEAASKGAKENNGLTLGILPFATAQGISEFVDIPVLTGMQEARNTINILTSHVIVACGMNPGTASEVALAIKAQKPVVLLRQDDISIYFFMQLSQHSILVAQNPQQTIDFIKTIL